MGDVFGMGMTIQLKFFLLLETPHVSLFYILNYIGTINSLVLPLQYFMCHISPFRFALQGHWRRALRPDRREGVLHREGRGRPHSAGEA